MPRTGGYEQRRESPWPALAERCQRVLQASTAPGRGAGPQRRYLLTAGAGHPCAAGHRRDLEEEEDSEVAALRYISPNLPPPRSSSFIISL